MAPPGVCLALAHRPWADYRPGRVLGRTLLLPNGAPLPPVCFKCGAHANLRPRNVTFRYVPLWSRVILVISPLIGLIVLAFATKRSRFDLPLCVGCTAQWSKWTLFAWLTFPAAVVLFGVGTAAAVALDGPGGAAVMGFAGLQVDRRRSAHVLLLRRRNVVLSSKIDKTHTWLTNVHPEAMRAAGQ